MTKTIARRERTIEELMDGIRFNKAILAKPAESLYQILTGMGFHANIHTARGMRAHELKRRRETRARLKELREELKALKSKNGKKK